MKRISLIAALGLLLSLGAVNSAQAAQVTAALPDFAVHLNGEAINNENDEYPLLRYKDITYFPMTWYHCRLLGLTSEWKDGSGLVIEQNDAMTSGVGYYPRQQANPQTMQASVADFAITVNGQVIDNSREPYPLLSFRDVTYFPLTWRFAHDAFGWEYTYSDKDGLAITSHNPQIKDMPVLSDRTWRTPVRLLDRGYYYYIARGSAYEQAVSTTKYWYGATSQTEAQDSAKVTGICRAPWDNSAHAQLIYTFAQSPASVDFAMLDGQPYIIYQQKAKEPMQALQIGQDGVCQPAVVNLASYINGSSSGNKLGQWTYGIRDKYLSRTQNGIDWEVYSAATAGWYGLTGEHVFYLHPIDGQNGYLYLASGSNTDKKLASEKVRAATICDGYVVCLLEASEDYGAKIFAPDGTLKLAITGPVDMISISGHTVMAVTNQKDSADDRIKLVQLK